MSNNRTKGNEIELSSTLTQGNRIMSTQQQSKFRNVLLTVAVLISIGVPTVSSPSLAIAAAGGGPSASLDINALINQSSDFLRNIGISPSGSVHETDDYWCTFNEWQARDNFANSRGTYDNGRWSLGTLFGGRWYCAAKHQ
jgi:hypothetical protein